MRVLGIDPGYERLGVAIVEKNGSEKEKLIFSDCITTPSDEPFPDRLLSLGTELTTIITDHSPHAVSIESLFFNTNQKTALLVAQARGVITYIASEHHLPFFEYNPLQIKLAVTGYGRSDKKQVITMLHHLVQIEKNITHDDEYDAIATALTCLASER